MTSPRLAREIAAILSEPPESDLVNAMLIVIAPLMCGAFDTDTIARWAALPPTFVAAVVPRLIANAIWDTDAGTVDAPWIDPPDNNGALQTVTCAGDALVAFGLATRRRQPDGELAYAATDAARAALPEVPEIRSASP